MDNFEESKRHKSSRKSKHKKNKKQKKKSQSSSESAEEVEWVEAHSIVKPKLNREDWMTIEDKTSEVNVPESKGEQLTKRDEDQWVPTFNRDEVCVSSRHRKKEAEMLRKQQDDKIWKQRELNPHWKNDGSGLPTEEPEPEELRLPSTTVGDGGLGYLRKAHERILDQAFREERSKEEIATERYGSYEKLLSMLAEAESRYKTNVKSRYPDERFKKSRNDRSGYKRPSYDDLPTRSPETREERTFRFQKPQDQDRRSKHMNKFSSKERKHSHHSEKYSTLDSEEEDERNNSKNSREKTPSWKKDDHSTKHMDDQTPETFSERNKVKELRKSSSHSSESITESKPAWQKRGYPSRTSEQRSEEYQPAWKKKSNSPKRNESSFNDEVSADQGSTQEDNPPNDSDEDLNELASKEMRKRLLGNLSLSRSESRSEPSKKERERVMLTKLDSSGQVRPIVHSGEAQGFKVQSSRKSRNKYFDDGSSYSLKNMFEREKLTTTADNLEMFMDVAAQCDDANDDNETSSISKKALSKMGNRNQEDKDYSKAMRYHQKHATALGKCDLCLENPNAKRHLIVSIGEQVYICIPNYQSLLQGHCIIVPKRHVQSFLALEEDEWREVEDCKRSLRQMFKEEKKSCLFLETSMNFQWFSHAVLECIPVPEVDGFMAPMYFKKAIEESEAEWALNIKLVHLKKGLRHSIPKNLPYFCVLFDPEVHSGYAHVIEDEKDFPKNFGKEVVGGMLDIDYNMLYKNRKEDPVKKANEALEFTKLWKSFKSKSD